MSRALAFWKLPARSANSIWVSTRVMEELPTNDRYTCEFYDSSKMPLTLRWRSVLDVGVSRRSNARCCELSESSLAPKAFLFVVAPPSHGARRPPLRSFSFGHRPASLAPAFPTAAPASRTSRGSSLALAFASGCPFALGSTVVEIRALIPAPSGVGAWFSPSTPSSAPPWRPRRCPRATAVFARARSRQGRESPWRVAQR